MKPDEPRQKVSFLDESKKKLKWKRLFAKKWFFPAVYMTTAALILGIAWWYQSIQSKEVAPVSKPTEDILLPEESIDKPETEKEWILPVKSDSEAVKTKEFYQENGTEKEKESALVKYANTYWPHTGWDFARKDGRTFDVVASLDGKIVRVEQNPVLGYVVEIQHDNGLVSVYQSLDQVQVKEGQTVKKGDPIAKAGQNQFEKEAGIHLHFEIRKNHQTVNPKEYLKAD